MTQPFPEFAGESRDCVLVEFTDAPEATDDTPAPVRDAVLRHLPSWLREAVAARGLSVPAGPSPVELAECLVRQARLLSRLGRHSEAEPRAIEAEQLLQRAGHLEGLADCFRVRADIRSGLGDEETALAYLRQEEGIRRRLAA